MDEKKYKLSILPLFEDDLNEILDYILYHLKNPIAAEHLVEEVEKQSKIDCPLRNPLPAITPRKNDGIPIIASQ